MERLKRRLWSLPENVATPAMHTLSALTDTVKELVPASVVMGVSPSQQQQHSDQSGVTSPRYKPKSSSVNVEAGQELLHKYQDEWEQIHANFEKNARSAAVCDTAIARLHETYERQVQAISTLQMLVSQIPRVNAQLNDVLTSLGELEPLFSDVEVALLALEDTIDAKELQERQLEQRYQVSLYKERRNAEYEELSARLRSDYLKRKQESDMKAILRRQQNQATYQKRFNDDMTQYRNQQGAKDFLEVPLRHDPDASLESVDLNEEQTMDRSQLRLGDLDPGEYKNDDANLEAFLNNDLLFDASPLPQDPGLPVRSDSDDSDLPPIVSSLPAKLSSEEEEEEASPPKADNADANNVSLPRTDSLYYTPDNTLEKLSEVALGD